MKVPNLIDWHEHCPDFVAWCREKGLSTGETCSAKEFITWDFRKMDEFKNITGKYPDQDRKSYNDWIFGSEQMTLF